MTQPVRRADIPFLARDARRAGELLAHKCGCGKDGCTLGEHLDRSTRDMSPGLRAGNTDPRARGSSSDAEPENTQEDEQPGVDPTITVHDRYQHLLQALRESSAEVIAFIQAYRPDRTVPLPKTASDTQFCSHHLETVGRCEPRHRGDLCRWCYDFDAAYRVRPPRSLLEARHEGRRITEAMITAAVFEARREIRRKRKKASRPTLPQWPSVTT